MIVRAKSRAEVVCIHTSTGDNGGGQTRCSV